MSFEILLSQRDQFIQTIANSFVILVSKKNNIIETSFSALENPERN